MQKAKRILAICLALCMLVSVLPVTALAVSISPKPANGTTEGQPFAPGTGGSDNFRIPGIVTLNDGTVVAVCDARWNHSADSSGLDTIVSVSKDNGENWEYTFANYLGDNGNVFNSYSSCIIDPAIATDGTTIYLIADLFPAGMAINTSAYRAQRGSTGYTAEGYLALRSDAENGLTFGNSGYDSAAASASYGYYLKDGAIYKTDGTQVEGYEVDAYFNITGNGVNTNLFFGDSPYKPFPTDYLYMTTSTDGLNWSEPTLINLKAADEQTLLIGPGNGTYDPTTGRMIFTAYEYDWGTQNACLVWRETDGTWHRSENAASSSHWTSEASSVVLDDGTVRIFYRDNYTNLFYSDYVYSEAQGNYVVSNREVATAAVKASNNQLTSIRYSKPVDGKDAILVACSASGSGSRVNGHLYVFTLNEDNTMDLAYDYDIFPDQNEAYAYNCISELNNGDIALLYESASAQITYHVIDMEEVLDRENNPNLTIKSFELLTGDSRTFTDNSGYYGDADISELDTSVAELTMTGEEIVTDAAQLGSDINYSGDFIDLADCLYTFAANSDGTWVATSTDAEGNTVYLYPGHTASSGYPNAESSNVPLQIFEGYEEDTFHLYTATSDNTNGSASYLYFDRSGLRWDRVSSFNDREDWKINCSLRLYKPVEGDGSAEIPGYERVTELSAITEGEYLVVAPGNDGNLYALYPNTATTNRYCQIAKLLGRTTVGSTELTFTGVGAGYTEVLVGSVVYRITVADVTEVPVEIPVGTSVTVTEPNGNYADADTSALNTSVATVVLTGTNGTNASGVSPDPVSELTDGTYVILNTRANKLVNNTSASAGAEAGTMAGLRLDSSISSFDAATAVWTFTAVDGGYTIQDANGKYMSIASNAAGLQDTAHTIHVERNGSTWVLEENNAYLNDAGGNGTTASGWQNSAARTDSGSQFSLYSYAEQAYGPSTELTFTGVYPGSTELTVGRTKFIVTVTGDIHDVALKPEESASFVVSGDQTQADTSALDESVATVELALTTAAYVSNGIGYSTEAVELGDCLYTFTSIDGGYYEVSATTADGTTVYLNHYASGNNNPSITAPGKIDVQTSSHTNMFKLVAQVVSGGTGSTRGLHFHSEAAMPYWNRCGNDSSAKCHEYLYRPVREGEQSSAEIDGYVLVTDIAEVVDGGQYLIVHNDDAGALYILHPSADAADMYSHVAKLAPATKVTFTGVAQGETSLILPGHVFDITVTGEAVHVHTPAEAVRENEVPADCENAGSYDSVVYCAECGEEISRESFTIPATGHTPAEAVRENEVPADCVTAGSYDSVVYCSVCGEEISRESFTIPATGHTPAEAVRENEVAPDCVTAGSYDSVVYCSVCNEEMSRETVAVPALGHDWQEDGSCSRCDEEQEQPVVNPFVDVNEGDYFYDSVLWALEKGITAGTSDTTFSPNQSVTRAQAVTFLWRAAGSVEPTTTVNPFTDVKETDYFYKAVLWAAENGITAGVGNGRFAPNQECTRGQIVTFLYTAKGRPDIESRENPFTDVLESDYFFEPVLWAVENNVTDGISETEFGPDDLCTRAQAVTFLHISYK